MKRITIADIADSPAVKRAQEFGIDLTLTERNLALSPTERLQRLSEDMRFAKELKKAQRGSGQ